MQIARVKWKVGIVAGWCLSVWLASNLTAENWPQWRGPHLNGSSTEKNLPSTWSKTEQVAWNTPLPGPSAATPVIWGDRVFVSSTDSARKGLLALCLDRRTGEVLWNQSTGEGMRRDDRSTFSSSSPLTDGERAIFFYSTGELVAFNFAGERLWSRNLQTDYGEFAFLWTFSSTPLLFEGKLYVQVLQRDVPVNGRGRKEGPIDSYLLALDPANGRTLWRQTRPSDAVAESHEAYSTPIPFVRGTHKEILVVGGDCLTGHDAATGRELWRWGTWNPSKIGHWRLVPSPLVIPGAALACGPKGSPIFAIKTGLQGKLDDSAIAWSSADHREVTADVPTPLFYDGDIFVLNDLRRVLSRVAPADGRVKWSVTLPGRSKFEASPTGADGKIYCLNFRGDAVVVDAAQGQILATIPMGESTDDMIRSTIAVSQGNLFIRTNDRLFCVGPKP